MDALVRESLNLMGVGMVGVLVFLLVTYLAVRLVGFLVLRFQPAESKEASPGGELYRRVVAAAAAERQRRRHATTRHAEKEGVQ